MPRNAGGVQSRTGIGTARQTDCNAKKYGAGETSGAKMAVMRIRRLGGEKPDPDLPQGDYEAVTGVAS